MLGACAAQKFEDVTPAVWTCLVKAAAAYGIKIEKPSGSQSKDGFTVAWDYDAAANALSLQCTSSPFWAPCGLINSKIHDIVDACM